MTSALPRHAAALAALLLLAPGCGGAPPSPPAPAPGEAARVPPGLVTAVQAALDSVHRAGRFPGATVGIVLPDGTSFGLAVGQSDTAARLPMRPSDRMLSGSVGKTYVAAVAMQLVGEGSLQLDAPIATYLGREPWFDRLPSARRITVRQLMNHTSGLVRYEMDPRFQADLAANPDRSWTPEQRLSYLFDTAAPFAPGEGWGYADTNYIVLGLILERLTGRPLYREVEERLLRPLGLRNTVPSDTPRIAGLAQGYAGPGNPFGGHDAMVAGGRLVVNPQFEWAGGGFASTAEDLARWARALYGGRAFPPPLLDQVLDGVEAPMLGREARYGLGVIVSPTPLGPSWGHSGYMPGYLTEMRYWPDRRIAVALQVNTTARGALGAPPGRIVTELARVVAAHLSPAGDTAAGRASGQADTLPRAVVERFFESMQRRDTAAMRALFIPGARLASTRRRDGGPHIRLLELDDLLRMAAATPEPYAERMPVMEARMEGDMATVWGPYDFHVGARLTNCGFNSFELFRTPEGWRIVHSASTIEVGAACAGSPRSEGARGRAGA
ncbi:MAG TPA: serine hydrolase [Longimicrobiaceae bacterium]|nr:serine hydrolase [Longimicrobiaceae bacterium]